MRFAFLILVAVVAQAHDPVTTRLTWSAEISRIVARRCSGCHHEGSRQAMPLMTYEDARPWAKAIRDEVLSRRMPPWGAVKGYGEFEADLSLTQDEINRIAEWVEGGAPEGDPRYLPKPMLQAMLPASAPRGAWVRAIQFARPVTVLAIRALSDVDEAKITAHVPDGRLVPMLWLYKYRVRFPQVFVYREPLKLPGGTKLVAEPTAHFELLVSRPTTQRPAR